MRVTEVATRRRAIRNLCWIMTSGRYRTELQRTTESIINAKSQKKIHVFGTAVVLCVVGCSSNSVITYSGDTLPLEQVAVLTPTAEAGHILSVDGENHINQRSVGTEFHLLSRNHTVAIFYRDQSSSNRNIWVIKETTLDHAFEAGHVYTVSTNKETFSDA